MTDLQQYVDAPGRDDLVKQVRAKIDELGITYVYYQFISVTGRIVGTAKAGLAHRSMGSTCTCS